MRRAMCRTVERRATRMHQMMKRLEVDALALIRLRNGDAYAEARSRCLQCEDSSICLLWLDKSGPDAVPDFCPNLEFFSACKGGVLRSLLAWRGLRRDSRAEAGLARKASALSKQTSLVSPNGRLPRKLFLATL